MTPTYHEDFNASSNFGCIRLLEWFAFNGKIPVDFFARIFLAWNAAAVSAVASVFYSAFV